MTVKIGAIFRSSQKHVNSGGLKALVGKKILEILLGLSKDRKRLWIFFCNWLAKSKLCTVGF